MKALFLDRDGVINLNNDGYIYKVEDFHFIPGIFNLCQQAQLKGYKIFIVTNQSGIARGYFTEKEFLELSVYVQKKFAEHNVLIERIYYCPYHPKGIVLRYKRDSTDRKPNPGMIIRAQNEFGVDLSQSVLIGDNETDIAAAINAGIKTKILFSHDKAPPPITSADYVIGNLLDAISII